MCTFDVSILMCVLGVFFSRSEVPGWICVFAITIWVGTCLVVSDPVAISYLFFCVNLCFDFSCGALVWFVPDCDVMWGISCFVVFD